MLLLLNIVLEEHENFCLPVYDHQHSNHASIGVEFRGTVLERLKSMYCEQKSSDPRQDANRGKPAVTNISFSI